VQRSCMFKQESMSESIINKVKKLIAFATEHQVTLIPRTAGTSLAGQCVGEGIVVDVSKHFTKIIAFNKEAKTIEVEPGIIRDELNRFLEPHGLFFCVIHSRF